MNVFPQFANYNNGFKKIAQYLGACFEGDSKNADFREFKSGSGFLGFVNKDQGSSGSYSGLSFVLFPFAKKKNTEDVDSDPKGSQNKLENNDIEDLEEILDKSNPTDKILKEIDYLCVISIGIGLSDLGDDEELANLPYMRRAYLKFQNLSYFDSQLNKSFFCKNSFADYTSPLTALYAKIVEIQSSYESMFTFNLDSITQYSTKLPVAAIIALTSSELELIQTFGGKDTPENKNATNPRNLIKKIEKEKGGAPILLRWLAQYAFIREWVYGGYKKKELQEEIIDQKSLLSHSVNSHSIKNEITNFLNNYKYVVIEGAPGVGKTWLANQVANNYNECFFTQFHAETTYADFIGGIRPMLNSTNIEYKYNEGILTKAILHALDNPNDKFLLIIDEINRANLANVLGPVFYLFEKNTGVRNAEIELQTEKKGTISLKNLPENLHVLATMNTADRSLAVADFALRRRFFWYSLFPHTLPSQGNLIFDDKNFDKIANMFEKYASDEELNLQPGQSYFLINNNTSYLERLKYEIMPLMKEYFNEGYLTKMIDEFSQYYTSITGEFMYR